jgi:ubiquinone/menaquinone biosynthesis C-methylase UbiE
LIQNRKHQEALIAMVMPAGLPSAEFAPRWLKRLPQCRGIGRIKSLWGRSAYSRWTNVAQEFLLTGPELRTAEDYFDFLLKSGMEKDDYNYFMHRFGQPRHLVALSIMTLIESPRKPVLDFGCGFGHLTRHLPRRVGHQQIIAADLEFMRLYLAKNFLAPDAFYVCCDGDVSLPFLDEFFSIVYSSDALYMVTNKVICSRELKRVADREGLIIVAGLRNRTTESQRYQTMPYWTYKKLFDSLPHRILANADVLRRYTAKLGPCLAQSSEKQTLDSEPWFSIVATRREELLYDRGRFEDWPHAEGRLELNPLYRPVTDLGKATGEILFRRTFPSVWYELEDGDCKKYEPETVSVSTKVLQDLSNQKRTAEMEDLIAQCVIVGIPDRFHNSSPKP